MRSGLSTIPIKHNKPNPQGNRKQRNICLGPAGSMGMASGRELAPVLRPETRRANAPRSPKHCDPWGEPGDSRTHPLFLPPAVV